MNPKNLVAKLSRCLYAEEVVEKTAGLLVIQFLDIVDVIGVTQLAVLIINESLLVNQRKNL